MGMEGSDEHKMGSCSQSSAGGQVEGEVMTAMASGSGGVTVHSDHVRVRPVQGHHPRAHMRGTAWAYLYLCVTIYSHHASPWG